MRTQLGEPPLGDFVFVRIEVAIRPDFFDPRAQGYLRKIELARPDYVGLLRWARLLDLYWLDLPLPRESVIACVSEIFWDHVLQWIFTGNLIPKATGKFGGLKDLADASPHRPGVFLALESRLRGGVTDNAARTILEAFEIVSGTKLKDARAASGRLFLVEGPKINENIFSTIARDILCNELIETWTILSETEIFNNERFHQERVKRDIPKVYIPPPIHQSSWVERVPLDDLQEKDLESLSQRRLWALNLEEMRVIQNHFRDSKVLERRRDAGIGENPTDVELEMIAQTWSEHCKHKIFNANIAYTDLTGINSESIPSEIQSLFKTTISDTTQELSRPWLLSVFEDNAGIIAFDDEDAIAIKVETHNSPSALDPYGGALTGVVGVNRDILGCGLGARPIFNTNVFCVAPLDTSPEALPDRVLHPRRILEGVRKGVEHGGNKSGIPTINGALVFNPQFLGKPLIFCGTAGILPRIIAQRQCEIKEVYPTDRICMVGGRIGKDGIHGATFSSLPLNEFSPMSAVQLGDPLTQKRMIDFILEARDLGLYRAITDNGAGGLSSSVGEMARLSGGARIDISLAKTKYPGLRPFELVVSESQERMTVAVPIEKLNSFLELAQRRDVEVSDLGEFTHTGLIEIYYADKLVAFLELEFLHQGVPKLYIQAEWNGPNTRTASETFNQPNSHPDHRESVFSLQDDLPRCILKLLSSPNICSREWIIRQYDHEVQGTSVIKPLHSVDHGLTESFHGPNDGAVIKPKFSSDSALAVACGVCPKLSSYDTFLMAQAAVDEAIRNLLCIGASFGGPDSRVAMVDNFCWPDPIGDSYKSAQLVRACFGLRNAALELSVPMISGKDSMKNDYRGKLNGTPLHIGVQPTLLITAIAKLQELKQARTSDFKRIGDIIYLLSDRKLGLLNSEFSTLFNLSSEQNRIGEPNWEVARRIFSWIGGSLGMGNQKLRSLHDVSDGGVLVAIAECMMARGVGANLKIFEHTSMWELCFGEGFHSFIASIAETDVESIEGEWTELGIPFLKLGEVTNKDSLELKWYKNQKNAIGEWSIPVLKLRDSWQKGGFTE